jgi:hypothetical protein
LTGQDIMSVEFNENKPVDYGYNNKKGGISNLIIKMGLAKDEKGANKVMLAISFICIAIAIYFMIK